MIIHEGKVIVATEGEYSEFGIMGHMKAVMTFDIEKEGERYLEQGGRLSEDAFLSYLVGNGFMEPIDDEVQEIHIKATRRFVDYPDCKEIEPTIFIT